MKIRELRHQVSNLARNQMTAEQTSQSLQALVNALDQLESRQEASQLRRQFRWLWTATATTALALSLTCFWLCWQSHQSRQELAQAQAKLIRQETQLGQLQKKLMLHEDALLKILKKMTSQRPSPTGQPSALDGMARAGT
jgi:cell division protein FtsL